MRRVHISATGLRLMEINLDWHDGTHIRMAVKNPNELLWNDARAFFPNHELIGASDAIKIPYYEFIALWRDFFSRFSISTYGIQWKVSPKLLEDVKRFNANQSFCDRNWTEEELCQRLRNAGFVRELKPFQRENVCHLVRRNQGATFSVPGAGKTTEALAFFFATAEKTDRLLVISPLNAFGAWDEQIVECTGSRDYSFVRLTGGHDSVRRLLDEDHRFMLTNYEVLRSRIPNGYIRDYLARHPNTYVYLDESHKVKNDRTVQADAIRAIQCLPKAKLIMSGTPMPQGPADLLTQYRFLFPDQSVTEADVVDKFKDVFVRTTATRLGIKDIHEFKHEIELDAIERELYAKMRKLTLDEVNRIVPSNDARYLRSLGKCIMRIMAFVSNPALVADRFGVVMPELIAYLQNKDSKKIAYVCKRARQLVGQGKKVLIWSSFVRNVELIANRLQDVGADYIHGGVKAGDINDPSSREGKIRRFHDPDGRHMVLVANPAAASEGISLHKACQYAIYLDRSFNAAHYLQSRDRIHRLGLPEGSVPEIELVVSPNTIDERVDASLRQKIATMADALNDPSIIPSDPQLIMDDADDDGVNDDDATAGISQCDVEAILAHLRSL